MIPVIRRPSNTWCSSVSLVSESESTTIKSIKIRVGHFKVKAVVVRWVQGVPLVRLRWPNTGEIRVQRHVGNPGVQIRERARAEVANCRRGSSSAHQQINRLHCLSVADGAVTQTAHGMCTASVVLWTGRIPACWIGRFHRHTHTFRNDASYHITTCREARLTFVLRGSASVGLWGRCLLVADRWSWWIFVQDLLRRQISENNAWQWHLMALAVTYGWWETLWEIKEFWASGG